MQWNLEQLRAFVASAESGSFSAAGRRLGRVQSAVSTQIALLEAELGVDLFDRSAHRPVLTAAGRLMLDEARELLRQCRQLSARAEALCRQPEAEFRLAVDESLPYQTMTRMFEALAVAFPHTRVHLPHGSGREVCEWVEQGVVPLGVTFAMPSWRSAEVEMQAVGTIEQVLIASAAHPLSSLARITRHELARHRQIVVHTPGQWVDKAHEGTSPRQPDPNNPNNPLGPLDPMIISPLRWETNSSYVAADLAVRGLGWTVLPINVATYSGLPANLRILDPGELSFPPLTVLLLRSITAPPGPLDAWMLEWLRAV